MFISRVLFVSLFIYVVFICNFCCFVYFKNLELVIFQDIVIIHIILIVILLAFSYESSKETSDVLGVESVSFSNYCTFRVTCHGKRKSNCHTRTQANTILFDKYDFFLL